MKHIKYASIGQFRHTVTHINHTYNFIGLDKDDKPMYDPTKEKPVLTFEGTVKLHGTNASVCYNDVDGFWAQSRKNKITPQNDNAGFAFFAEANKEVFMAMINQVKELREIDTSTHNITIYGEWVGQGIQKGVAIAQLPKSFFIFGGKISPVDVDSEEQNRNIKCFYLKSPENRIYNIRDYPTYWIDIDFNRPDLSQNQIVEMTIEVEEQCPVAKEFGIEGIGEGIVFTHVCNDGTFLRFKSKGEKHSKTKVKTIKEVDSAQIQKLMDVAEEVTPEWRLEQFLNEVCNLNNGGEIDRKHIGAYIRAVIADIVKEDIDILVNKGVEIKDIGKYVSKRCTTYFFSQEKF